MTSRTRAGSAAAALPPGPFRGRWAQPSLWFCSVSGLRSTGTALDAAQRLDFGGVLVNEVPTWRADQQPYGGVRDAGNTREGPAYAIEELTERRMVVIQK